VQTMGNPLVIAELLDRLGGPKNYLLAQFAG
jgi:hypothetical protein